MIEVVGVPAQGPDEGARRLLANAEVVLGGDRHLAMAREAGATAELIRWPSPLKPALPQLMASLAGRRVVVLASGDPLVSGIGSTLIDLLGSEAVRIRPAVSSVALARAEMRWPAESCDVVSLVGRDPDRLRRHLAPGNRVVVLSGGPDTPAQVARILVEAGLGATRMTVLADLGTDSQARLQGTAEGWMRTGVPALNVLCLQVAGESVAASLAPGLPDEAYDNDGQLTKRHVRAAALAHLRPLPGELLWDVGAGAGSIGIEWARQDPRNRTIAIEHSPERAERIARNAAALGVPELRVVRAEAVEAVRAPGGGAALGGGGTLPVGPLPTPDAVFIGGGATADVVEACWHALRPGGRLVVHTVTIETEQVVIDAWQRHGGDLARLAVETAQPIGRYTGWKPARPVVQWAVTKPDDPAPAAETATIEETP